MTLAQLQQSQFAGDSTQATFLLNLSAAMLQAGFSLITSYSASPTLCYVWEYSVGNGATYQNLIVEAGFTAASTFKVDGYSAFSGTSGSNVCSAIPTATLTLNSNFNLWSINHPEMRGVVIFQSATNIAFVGYFRPLTTPSSWSENSYPFAFIPRALNPWCASFAPSGYGSAPGGLQTISSLRPSGISSTGQFIGGFTNSVPNPAAGNARNTRVAPLADSNGITLINTSNTPSYFDITDFSTDIQSGSSYGMNFNDYISNGTLQYTFVDGNTSEYSSRLFIRTQ